MPVSKQCAFATDMRIYDYKIIIMKTKTSEKLKDGGQCKVAGGTHAGKSGVRDVHTSKAGHVTITVEQKDRVKFKTLGKNVVIETNRNTESSSLS